MSKDTIVARLASEPRYERVMYEIIDICSIPQCYSELETRVGEMTEMRHATHKPATVIAWLVDEGALNDTYPEPREGEEMAPSEFGDGGILIEVTAEGAEALSEYRQIDLLGQLLDDDPARAPAYLLALDACRERRLQSYMESLLIDEPSTERPKKVYPAYILDRLEHAKAITWDEGWLITPDGVALMKRLREREEMQ